MGNLGKSFLVIGFVIGCVIILSRAISSTEKPLPIAAPQADSVVRKLANLDIQEQRCVQSIQLANDRFPDLKATTENPFIASDGSVEPAFSLNSVGNSLCSIHTPLDDLDGIIIVEDCKYLDSKCERILGIVLPRSSTPYFVAD